MSDSANTGPGGPGSQGGGSDGTTQDWVVELGLDDATRESLSKAGFRDAKGLAEGYVNLSRKLGSSVQVPGDGATEEEWAAFYNKLRPKSAEEYGLKPPEAPPGLQPDQERLKAFTEAAHKIGLTKRQAQNLFDWFNQAEQQRLTTAVESQKQATKEAMDKMKSEDPDFEKDLPAVKAWLKKQGGEELMNWFTRTGEGNNLPLAKLLFSTFRRLKSLGQIGEDTLEGGGLPGGGETREKGVLNYDRMRTIRKVENQTA